MLDNKHVFWQAFIAAMAVFLIGLFIGFSYEGARVEEIQDFYFDSQSDLLDFKLSTEIIYNSNLSCDQLYEKGIEFADRIFEEALKLEKYDDSNKLDEHLVGLHRRYDILRVSLWKDLTDINKECQGNRNVIIYFYDYVDTPIITKATQGAMGSFLIELKEKYSDDIILIPVAVDTHVESINHYRDIYGLEETPMIFVNNIYRFSDLDSLKDIERILYKKKISL